MCERICLHIGFANICLKTQHLTGNSSNSENKFRFVLLKDILTISYSKVQHVAVAQRDARICRSEVDG